MQSFNICRQSRLLAFVSCVAFAICFASTPMSAWATVLGDVSVADRQDYTQIYQFNPNPGQNWSTTSYYNVNNSGTTLPLGFSRIGYYMELQAGAGPRNWVWVSMDAYTTDLTKIGVPTVANGEFYHFGNTAITNMTVRSNVGSVVTGTGILTGNIEFWPSNYNQSNQYGVPGANGSTFDFGDGGAGLSSGYGSMQFHNYGASQVLFNYGQFNGGNGDLGIGGTNDYTFASNAGSFNSIRSIEIWVQEILPIPAPEPSSVALLGLGLVGLVGHRRRQRQQRSVALGCEAVLARGLFNCV